MADKSVEIRITGLRELNAAFKAVNADLPKHLRTRFKVAADHVVGVAQQKMPFRTGEAARSLKPVAGTLYAGISRPAGGVPWKDTTADYYPWLDFGGTTGRGHNSGVVHARRHGGQAGAGVIERDRIKGGRFLYPAIAESTPFLIKAADSAMADTCAEADLKTEGSIG